MTDLKIKLVIPGKPPFELPYSADEKQRAALDSQLKGLGLADPKDYLDLYPNNKIDDQMIQALFERRGGPVAPARRMVPYLANPDGLIDCITRELRRRRDTTIKGLGPQARFIFQATEEPESDNEEPAIIDGQKAPPGAEAVTKATNAYLKVHSQPTHSVTTQALKMKKSPGKTLPPQKPLPPPIQPPAELTNPWLDALPAYLRTLAEIAAFGDNGEGRGIIFHEPHHELSPGMLLIKEIYRALLSKVADLVEEIDSSDRFCKRRKRNR
jgi:hypothetical protein